MFCSTSIRVHLLRGASALGLAFAAIYLNKYGVIWASVAAVGAVLLLRGCPACWTIGLLETIARSKRGDPQGPSKS